MMQIKDLQFPKHLILNEMDLSSDLVSSILNTKVQISKMGEPDTVVHRGNELILNQPSSIVRFLFNVIYHSLAANSAAAGRQDMLSLGLLCACKDYVFNDYQTTELPLPVLVSLDKLPVPSIIIKAIVEPVIGEKIQLPSLMFSECNFVDVTQEIKDSNQLASVHNCPQNHIERTDYPFLIVNHSIQNRAAQMADITASAIKMTLGTERSQRIIHAILLDENILNDMISALKTLEGDPSFVFDFLKFFESNVELTDQERTRVAQVEVNYFGSDNYLRQHIKQAQQTNYTPQVFRQWHQWSLIVGLIEKQLEPVRGSMWPASQTLKPFEDKRKEMIVERAKKKGKTQLNYEELLETAREVYNHKATQPGELYEVLLKDHRVWKM